MRKVLIIFTMLFTILAADNLEDGLMASIGGNYEKAVKIFQNIYDKGLDKNSLEYKISPEHASVNVAAAKLGWMYQRGEGVEQDYKKAIYFFQQLADQGIGEGYYALATMYKFGRGVEKDYKKAVELYKKGANKDYPAAQANLAYMYGQGLGVKKDYTKSIELNIKATENGDAIAPYNLGYIYVMGTGVKVDKVKAYQYWKKAANRGNTDAKDNLNILCKESPWACK